MGVLPPSACFGGGGREAGVSRSERRRRGCLKEIDHCDIHAVGPAVNREEKRRAAGRSVPDIVASSLMRHGDQGVPEGVVALVFADVLAGEQVVPERVHNNVTWT